MLGIDGLLEHQHADARELTRYVEPHAGHRHRVEPVQPAARACPGRDDLGPTCGYSDVGIDYIEFRPMSRLLTTRKATAPMR